MQVLRLRAATAVRQRADIGKTYVVYGLTDRLCELLTAQADYRIDPAQRAAGEVRETAEGEEIGEPVDKSGVWHAGLFPSLPPTTRLLTCVMP